MRDPETLLCHLKGPNLDGESEPIAPAHAPMAKSRHRHPATEVDMKLRETKYKNLSGHKVDGFLLQNRHARNLSRPHGAAYLTIVSITYIGLVSCMIMSSHAICYIESKRKALPLAFARQREDNTGCIVVHVLAILTTCCMQFLQLNRHG